MRGVSEQAQSVVNMASHGTWHVSRCPESPLIDKLISHIMPMSRIQDAFGLLSAGEAAKIVLHPWE